MASLKHPPGECVFCGKGGLSKEHLWPQWLTRMIGDDATKHTRTSQTSRRLGAGVQEHAPIRTVDKHGGTGAISLRVVCRGCNGGWMSRLQVEAKPFVAPMVAGRPFLLCTDAQRLVSLWAMMTTVVAESLDRNEFSAVGADDRQHLYGFAEDPSIHPPGHWQVWAGFYVGGISRQRVLRSASHWAKHEPTEGGDVRYNVQTTVLVAGHMVLLVASHHDGAPALKVKNNGPRLVRLWPPQFALVGQGLLRNVTDEDVEHIGLSLSRVPER